MKRFSSPFDNLPAIPEPLRISHLEQVPTDARCLSTIGAAVIDLIPQNERRDHAYLRGASLGAAIYNLLQNGYLNTATRPDEPRMHFADGPSAYSYANSTRAQSPFKKVLMTYSSLAICAKNWR